MDDFSITDARLEKALENLRQANRWLGGHASLRSALAPLVHPGARLRLLDVGTGAADAPAHLVQWADARGAHLEVVAVDANPATADYARRLLDRWLPPHLRARVRVDVQDALALPYAEGAFDGVTAALFMHHFDREKAVALLHEMQRIARRGLVVSDLHRHPVAYYGLKALGAVMPVSPMFRHDGPLSVLRGYTRGELQELARAAGLGTVSIRWHWAFRWVLSTVTA